MQVGDVLLFVGGNCLIDKVIRFCTHSEFTHAALAINETEYIEAWWDGVRKNNITRYENIIDRIKDIVVFTPITPLNQSQQTELIRYALGKIGEPYNYLQLAGFIIKKTSFLKYNPFGSKYKTICSQLVFQAYKHSFNIDLLPNIEDYSVAPRDLAASKLLRQKNIAV